MQWYKIYKKECVFNIHSTIPHKNLSWESEVPFQEQQKMYTTSVKMPEASPMKRVKPVLFEWRYKIIELNFP